MCLITLNANKGDIHLTTLEGQTFSKPQTNVVLVNSFATPGTVARQAPLSMGFPRQENWSGWPFPSAGGLSRTSD